MEHFPLLNSYIYLHIIHSGLCFCAHSHQAEHFQNQFFYGSRHSTASSINILLVEEWKEEITIFFLLHFAPHTKKAFPILSRMRKSNNVTHFPRDPIHNIICLNMWISNIFVFMEQQKKNSRNETGFHGYELFYHTLLDGKYI